MANIIDISKKRKTPKRQTKAQIKAKNLPEIRIGLWLYQAHFAIDADTAHVNFETDIWIVTKIDKRGTYLTLRIPGDSWINTGELDENTKRPIWKWADNIPKDYRQRLAPGIRPEAKGLYPTTIQAEKAVKIKVEMIHKQTGAILRSMTKRHSKHGKPIRNPIRKKR